jgi:hypothetical protein
MTENNQSNSLPILTLDMELYEKYLMDSNLTDAQKQELLETFWNLICEFVLLGFGITSTQQVIQDPCGQREELSTENIKTNLIAVDSTSQGKAFGPFAQNNAAPNAQDIRGGVHG